MRVALGRAWSSETTTRVKEHSGHSMNTGITIVSTMPSSGHSQTLITQHSDAAIDESFGKISDKNKVGIV